MLRRTLAIVGSVVLAAVATISSGAQAASPDPAASPDAVASLAPGASPAAGRVVDLAIGDGVITPATVTVAPGETVTFNASNVNTVEVELIVGLASEVANDDGASLQEAEHIAPGTSKQVSFTFDGAGPFAYGDQVDDHYDRGAKGDIVIAAPGASPAAGRVVDLAIGDGVITPATVTVAPGETVTFNASNVNTVEVELIVGLASEVANDDGASLQEAEHIAPGTSKQVSFTFDGAGPFAYGDQVDDHYDRGAKGDIVIAP